MSVTASSYSITMRLHTAPDHGIVGAVATAISAAGGVVTAIDVVDSTRERLVLDVTCSASDADHSHELEKAVDAIDGVEVYKVSDRTFLLHIGGKIEVNSKVPLKNRDDLSMAYTPGVGRVSMALYHHPEDVSRLTIKGNSVAVVTDGSAVLGLGNIGPGAALPVMEGKAALFKRFANIDAWPICLASQDTDEIVKAVEMIAPGFGGINLEDIAAPRCFEIERRLRESLDIPVFHDDQHGTAIVVLAALTNALRVVGKELHRVPPRRLRARAPPVRRSSLSSSRPGSPTWSSSTARAPSAPVTSSLSEAHPSWRRSPTRATCAATCTTALCGADVFIGVSAPGILQPEWIADMAEKPVVFALANPDPEVDPAEAEKYAAVVASGRSDYPNQINNVLAFPGVFRGLLDARAPTSPSTCCCAPPTRSRTSSATRSSTRTSSSRRSSTPRSRRRSPRPSAAPAPPADAARPHGGRARGRPAARGLRERRAGRIAGSPQQSRRPPRRRHLRHRRPRPRAIGLARRPRALIRRRRKPPRSATCWPSRSTG